MTTALVGLRVVLALACVLGLIWFAGRRLSGTPGLRKPRSVPLTVIGRQSLGKGAGIALVEVAGRVLLLGVGEQGVRVLTEIDLPPVAEPVVAVPSTDLAELHPLLAADRALVLREELDLQSLSADPAVMTDPAVLARLAGLAATSSARGTSALHGSILSRDTWRRAVDVVQQRTVRR
ncbi:MAG: flagellar biosynthetic protein FliO [Cellulomonas sp.]|nr:flagellar biosynthetic protein FliO [Cellulomonas sp.]